jgi:hypothetical protein
MYVPSGYFCLLDQRQLLIIGISFPNLYLTNIMIQPLINSTAKHTPLC